MKPRQPIHLDMVPIPAEFIPEDKRGSSDYFSCCLVTSSFEKRFFDVLGKKPRISGFTVSNHIEDKEKGENYIEKDRFFAHIISARCILADRMRSKRRSCTSRSSR